MTADASLGGEDDVFVFPASYSQQRLWFLDQLQPGSGAYNVPAAVRLQGPLDVALLARALNEVVARHESLRTTFASVAGVPVQVVTPTLAIPLPVEDLSALPADAREARLARALAEAASVPFDLKEGPLIRACLVRLAPDDHVLLVNTSHLVTDGISVGIVFRELSRLYAARASGQPSPLPPVAIQYADYALWQKDFLQGPELDRLMTYWREQLSGELPPSELPPDRPRPPVRSGRGNRLRTRLLHREGAEALAALCRQERTSSFSGLLAAFALLMQRYTGQDEVLLGSPFGNRGRAEIEDSVGFYAATVVLRLSLAGEPAPTFRELLGRAREVVAGAAAHQDVPFEKIVEVLKPARAASANPFFQIMIGYLPAPESALELPGVTITPVDAPHGDSMFDLFVQLEEGRDGVAGYFTYSSDLYDGETIARAAANLQQVITAAVAAPDLPISELTVMTDAERQRVLVEWNQTALDAPPACIHAEVERQAARTPKAVAVRTGDAALTYEELEGRANRLAAHLAAMGVGPDGLVGICLPRGNDMVVAVLATLKAGGAYLPLDPAYPRPRLEQMIVDSRVGVVVTTAALRGDLPLGEARAVCVDGDAEAIDRHASGRVDGGARPENLAYVIYTSGSTGTPKGVMLEHRNVTNFFAGMDRVLGDRSGNVRPGVWLAVTSLSFDISVLELLWTLARGFQVIIAAEDDKAGAFAATVAAHGVTHFQCTPSMAGLLVADDGSRAALGRLEAMLVGGEALSPDLARALRGALRGALIDVYGPTETTIWSTTWQVPAGATGQAPQVSQVSIGRPLANTTVYVLDARREPVPIGVAGELYIGGAGVARGYLRRPELTGERFVPNPFGEGRLYRTGDLVRWRVDGNGEGQLEFLGRLDHQVKIRGHRIELGEIEAALRELGGARDVVVVARPGPAGVPRLVAYLAGAAPTAADLRRLLRERLPEPMIPSAFVVLERLPLTPNGKVDRQALPEPQSGSDASPPGADDDYLAPRTPTEQAIAEIWRQVLGVARVSVYDNFFDLGGHSLLSTQVMHHIEERLRKRLNVAELIMQNLAQVSAKCDQATPVDAAKGRGVFGVLRRMIAKG
ncbi:MAG TPA: amino acid adenylation domain-containing protein [Polyangia bacterium]|nr:amino acid adenylation domain-containing protein [Polyangia bacterium]